MRRMSGEAQGGIKHRRRGLGYEARYERYASRREPWAAGMTRGTGAKRGGSFPA
jgi:hypothetical protein